MTYPRASKGKKDSLTDELSTLRAEKMCLKDRIADEKELIEKHKKSHIKQLEMEKEKLTEELRPFEAAFCTLAEKHADSVKVVSSKWTFFSYIRTHCINCCDGIC